MLSPDYLASMTDDIVALYQEYEDAIIRDIVRRLINTDFEMTQSAVWQMERVQQAGFLYDDVVKEIGVITGKAESELKALFEDAGMDTLAFDDSVYKKAGLKPLPLKQSPAMLDTLLGGLKKTRDSIQNLTMTTANTSQASFIQSADMAYMKIASGGFDYNSAIRQAVKEVSEHGAFVLYPTGHRDRVDVAMRRATLTGVSQTCGQIQIMRMDEMDCDLVEITAHAGARADHEVWQGQIFSRSGKHEKYPDFVLSTGYGSGEGLKGWNCRHDFYPFYDGISKRAYSDEMLAEWKNHRVTYNGKEYTDYEASQIQRKMEREIRATKRNLVGFDTAIKENTNKNLKDSLQADFTHSSAKLKKQENMLNDFLSQTERKKDTARVQVVGFRKSQAQKSVWANKKGN